MSDDEREPMDLEPKYRGDFVIGYVHGVNGEGAEVLPELRVTRHEAEVLFEYWLEEATRLTLTCEVESSSGSYEMRMITHGRARAKQLAALIGEPMKRIIERRLVRKLREQFSHDHNGDPVDFEPLAETLRSLGLPVDDADDDDQIQ